MQINCQFSPQSSLGQEHPPSSGNREVVLMKEGKKCQMLIQEVLEMAETVKECRNNSKFCDVETAPLAQGHIG